MVGPYCIINSSEHLFSTEKYITDQGFVHGNVRFGKDVWLGSNVTVVMNTSIEDGAIVGANSLASGTLKSFGIFSGVPAKLIRKR